MLPLLWVCDLLRLRLTNQIRYTGLVCTTHPLSENGENLQSRLCFSMDQEAIELGMEKITQIKICSRNGHIYLLIVTCALLTYYFIVYFLHTCICFIVYFFPIEIFS